MPSEAARLGRERPTSTGSVMMAYRLRQSQCLGQGGIEPGAGTRVTLLVPLFEAQTESDLHLLRAQG